jgi:putative ABC transport system permease protein
MSSATNDLRFALRQLRKARGFTFTAVFTLALGIGASSAIFCLMDGLWLHPMPVPHSDRLVRIFATTPQDQHGLFSYPEYQTFTARATAFQGSSSGLVAMGGRGTLMPNPDGTSVLLLNNVVSDNFFTVLGVHPLVGRLFSPADAQQLHTRPALVLGYLCWQRYFAGDPHIVGRQIALRHGKGEIIHFDILGVLPRQFRNVDPNSDRDIWIPAEAWAALNGDSELTTKDFRWFQILGRLAPSSTVAQANQQVAAVAGALAAADAAGNHRQGARALSDLNYRLQYAGTTGLLLFAVVAGVVLLCTVNVAHLLLARAFTRGPEVALRISLGATRWVVARQLLVENLLLCALGWIGGLGAAAGIAVVLPRLLVGAPDMLVSHDVPLHFQLDWRVFCIAGLLALATMLLLALVPLLQVARPQLVPALRSASSQRTSGRTPVVRRIAVWLQIGVSFALLVSTGALVQSFLNTRTQSIGITRDQVLVLFTQDPDPAMRDDILAKFRALPGVQHAAYAIRSPLMPSEGGMAAQVLLPNHPELHDPVEIKYNAVSPDYLSLIGTRILRGRGFAPADNLNGPAAIIVSQAMAQKYWPSQDPIGKTVRLPGFNNGAPGSTSADLEARIIGVAENAPINDVGEISEPYMYIPFRFSQEGEVTFVVQTSRNAMSMAQEAREVLIHTNPLLDPMFDTSLPELIRSSTGSYQMMAELVTALGVIGLFLTIIGLYGFLAFTVAQRRREIGIRMALGASRQGTALLVLRDTAKIALIGFAIGLLLAAVATRLETSMLFGVHALNPVSLVAACALLIAASLGAAWLPARRAASVEPMQALRTE